MAGDVEAILVDDVMLSVDDCFDLAVSLYKNGTYSHEEDGAHWICIRPNELPQNMVEVGDFGAGAMDDALDPEPESEDPDDRAPCIRCGAPVDDGIYTDNHGLCTTCDEAAFEAEKGDK